MLQAALVIPTAKLDISHILQSSPSPPPLRTAPPPPLARSISVPTSTENFPLVSSPTTSTASRFSTATAPANFYSEQDRRAHGPLTTLAPLASSAAAASSKRGSPATPHPLASPAKKQSKWSPQEDVLIVQLRGSGMKWEDISKRLPGRSSISCRLHYQNYLERKSEWDDEKKNKLARLYDRMKPEMWANVAKELGVPWRAAEAMHWILGEHDMAHRAGTTPFAMAAARNQSPSDIAGGSLGDPTSPHAGGRGGGLEGSSGRSSDGDSRGEGHMRRRRDEGGSQGMVLPSVAELETRMRAYEGGYDDEEDDESEGR